MAEQTYETAIKRLEEVVEQLENGKLPLDKLLEYYEEGTKLAAFCNTCLDKAQLKITELAELEANDNE
ncbi:MAG: exodeoxyribonuclease VII small subunit [Clostridiales bacterium]|nr:exodeoxyribonuclease VII small subunit [Clostridiales bacterium]